MKCATSADTEEQNERESKNDNGLFQASRVNGMDERIIVQSSCPYCGEQIDLLVDWSAGKQAYVEDCEVCCRPMHLRIAIDQNGDPVVETRQEDD